MTDYEKRAFANPEMKIHHAIALWAAECAEHTLHLFEDEYPGDKRPRLAIEALRQWVRGELKIAECRAAAFEAHSAARAAKSKTSVAAARATGQAVAVAHMYTHAPHAADYAAKAFSSSVDPSQSKAAENTERAWQLSRLGEELRPIVFSK